MPLLLFVFMVVLELVLRVMCIVLGVAGSSISGGGGGGMPCCCCWVGGELTRFMLDDFVIREIDSVSAFFSFCR